MMLRRVAVLVVALTAFSVRAEDWVQFRGPGGSSRASSGAKVPTEWGDSKNLKWKVALPGPGSSSPIIVGSRVFVTCYTGYGVEANSGDSKNLVRHLLCYNRADGKEMWRADITAFQPEDRYAGFIMEHGYASSTPISDGKAVYVFFGKSGVCAFDLDGKKLWQTPVGQESDSRRWGTASSPILYKDFVIVNAASESRSIRALDKATGKEMWKAEGERLDLCYATPALVEAAGRTELVVAVPGEIWSLNPDTGKMLWFAQAPMSGNVSPSVVAKDGTVYATGGFQSRGTIAVKAGGSKDVTSSNVAWSVRESTYVPSPLVHAEHLYWVDDQANAVCLNAVTGKTIYKEKLPLKGRGGRPVYASVVLVGDTILAVTRTSGTFVLPAKPEFKVLANNQLTDASNFNATPAVVDNQLFLRSDKALYCISAE